MRRKSKIRETDYLFLSAWIRAQERSLLSGAQIERMLEAPTAREAALVLAECGYPVPDRVDADGAHRMIAGMRARVAAGLSGLVPDLRMVDVFRAPYDYHNAKAVLKARARGEEAAARLLVDAGRITGAVLARALETGQTDALPPVLARAARDAWEVLERSHDPQRADVLLDRACFTELSVLAEESGSAFLAGYVRLQVDAANLRTLVRVLRTGRGMDFLRGVLLEGGEIAPGRLAEAAGDGRVPEKLYAGTALEDAARLGVRAAEGGEMAALERACGRALDGCLRAAQMVPFGEQPLIAYLAAREREYVTVRVILTGLLAGLHAGAIRERLGE